MGARRSSHIAGCVLSLVPLTCLPRWRFSTPFLAMDERNKRDEGRQKLEISSMNSADHFKERLFAIVTSILRFKVNCSGGD